MKFQVTKSVLDSVCTKFGRLLSSTVTIPILEGVLVEVKESHIDFIVSNGDESMLERVHLSEDVCVQVIGRAVFPRTLFSMTRKLKSGIIDFSINNSSQITVKQKKTQLDFQSMSAEDFPNIMTNQKPINTFQLPYSIFKSFIEDTVYAVATSDTRPILQGVKLEFTPSSSGNCIFSSVATDSHRLAQCKTKNYETNENTVVMVPAGASLVQAVKSFNGNTEIGVSCYKNQIAFVSGNKKTIMYCRLLEGTYPATSKLIPQTTSFFTLQTTELVGVVELIKTIKKDTVCKLEYKSGSITISSNVPGGISKVQQELTVFDCQTEDNFTFSCSAEYLLESLKTISTEKVMLKVVDPLRPFLVSNVYEDVNNYDEQIQLILPIRSY